MSTAGNYSPISMESLGISGMEMSPMSIDEASPNHAPEYFTIPGATGTNCLKNFNRQKISIF